MQKIFKAKISVMLTVALVLAAIGGTWGITYTVIRAESKPTTDGEAVKTVEEIYAEAVQDSMTVEADEIFSLVSLEKGEPYAVYNEDGRVLLITFHKYPDSYPNGAQVKLEWGEVWTFTGGELADWYKKNQNGVTDWHLRLRQLIGLTPDNEATHFTAMWVDSKNVKRPANIQDIGDVIMSASLAEDTDEVFKDWFDGNIVWSYFDSAYPWTRLGYTYDWAADAEDEYGLSEFLVASGSEIEVAYTVTAEKMLSMLADGSWRPDTAVNSQNAA